MAKSSISEKQLLIKQSKSFVQNVVRMPLANREIMILISNQRPVFAPIPPFLEKLLYLMVKYAVSNGSFIKVGYMNLHRGRGS